MAKADRYGVVADERGSETLCAVAIALRDAVIELEKLYAMTGKLDNPTQMRLKDLKERLEEVIRRLRCRI